MKVNLSRIIKNLGGDNLDNPESKTEKKESLTMKVVCVNALLTPTKKDGNLNGVEKAKRFELAMRIYKEEKEIELDIDDAKLVKDLIGNLYGALVVGQAYRILEEK